MKDIIKDLINALIKLLQNKNLKGTLLVVAIISLAFMLCITCIILYAVNNTAITQENKFIIIIFGILLLSVNFAILLLFFGIRVYHETKIGRQVLLDAATEATRKQIQKKDSESDIDKKVG